MKRYLWLLLLAAVAAPAQSGDETAIRKTIALFNDRAERPRVVALDADIAPLWRFAAPEISQVYFEAGPVRLLTPEVAFVDAVGSQYGSVILKRSMPACFVLRKIDGEWKIAVLRVAPGAAPH
jgi:hypothetical protein